MAIKNVILVAITGSICTGKTFVCSIITKLGFPVFNCDAEVHKLLKTKPITAKLKCQFPTAFVKGKLDRIHLGDIVFTDATKRKTLETIIYPALFERQNKFIAAHKKKSPILFFEVPLLYEKNLASSYDRVILTYAPQKIMKQRSIKKGIDLKKFSQILKIQMKTAAKKRMADYPLNTNQTKAKLIKAVKNVIKDIRHEHEQKRNNSGP